MDGYAVRAADVASLPATLAVIGEAAAGHPFAGTRRPRARPCASSPARRCPTAPMPSSSRRTRERDGDKVIVREGSADAGHVRPRGFDFREGEVLLARRPPPRARARCRSPPPWGTATLPVRRRPRVAILSTGDELVPPGSGPGPARSSPPITWASPRWPRPPAPRPSCSASPATRARASTRTSPGPQDADVIVTIGGASVGDHDLVGPVLEARGMALAFWKIAMRPGKPLMFGRLGASRVLGLPGNPVSSLVCTRVFLVPLIRALLGPAGARRAPAAGPRRRGAGGQRPAPALHARHLRARRRRPARGHARALPGQLAAGAAGRGRLPAGAPAQAPPPPPPAASCPSCRSISESRACHGRHGHLRIRLAEHHRNIYGVPDLYGCGSSSRRSPHAGRSPC